MAPAERGAAFLLSKLHRRQQCPKDVISDLYDGFWAWLKAHHWHEPRREIGWLEVAYRKQGLRENDRASPHDRELHAVIQLAALEAWHGDSILDISGSTMLKWSFLLAFDKMYE